MARQIQPYVWEAVRIDFERGMSQADIRKKHGVGVGALGNKIKRNGWRLSQEQTATLSDFKTASGNLCESFHNANKMQKNEMTERIMTIMEDNELIQNNRRIAKMLQGVISTNKENITLANIRNVSGTIRDIETIANPQAKQEINVNTNATAGVQNNNVIQVVWE